jgi:hypothetical protein
MDTATWSFGAARRQVAEWKERRFWQRFLGGGVWGSRPRMLGFGGGGFQGWHADARLPLATFFDSSGIDSLGESDSEKRWWSDASDGSDL